MTDALNIKGSRSALPKGLAEAADRAQVFSAENQEKDRIKVSLKSDRLLLRGEGSSGWYVEAKRLNYSGEPIQFLIAPQMLMDIVSRHNECKINKRHLLIDTGAYIYTTCLGIVSNKEKK